MQRQTKRHTKHHANNPKRRPRSTNVGLWLSKPGADMALLLSKVRAAQVRRLHLR